MSVQTRTTAIQNEIVRLYFQFTKDGQLANPAAQPLVEILDTDGVTLLDTVPAQLENTGIWYADYFVPQNLPLGSYYDRWTWQWGASSSVQEATMIFEVHGLDSYINFLSTGIANQVSNRTAQMLVDLQNMFIYEAQHIPVHWEMGMRIQQENRQKRAKTFYYFTLTGDTENYSAYEGDTYFNNGQKFTVFETIYKHASSSSSTSSESESSLSQDNISSSSSSTSSTSSESSNSSQSSSTSGDESSSSEGIVDTPETEYSPEITLTCVGTGEPKDNGTLVKQNGSGSDYLAYSSYTKKGVKLSTVYQYAYQNWKHEPRPRITLNNRLIDDGWYADYMGKIYFDRVLSPEDMPRASYHFAYFSEGELLSFLNLGLHMMNSLPPASESYASLQNAPGIWSGPILLFASVAALRRLVFGLNWQEKMIIFGSPDGSAIEQSARNAQERFQSLYSEYNELWQEAGKNAKTRKLPSIRMYVSPEYTLPGGRCLSEDTCIKCLIDGSKEIRNIASLHEAFSNNAKIDVFSNIDNDICVSSVSKIWFSGFKITYTLQTNSTAVRLSAEHLVYDPVGNKYKPAISFRRGDYVLVNNKDILEMQQLIAEPQENKQEKVYDIEVPQTQNLITNGIVSHNSRWFRYLYKSGA